jgi:hypothetical protein
MKRFRSKLDVSKKFDAPSCNLLQSNQFYFFQTCFIFRMTTQKVPLYPIESQSLLSSIVEDAIDFCICHGVVMRKENTVRGLFFNFFNKLIINSTLFMFINHF